MPREDLEKLLGGFATNTLTEEERKALFEAALTDQALFNALADEQALKELLDDPRSRRQLLASLEAKTQAKQWFQQSWSWALAGSLAAVVLAVTLVTREAGVPPAGPPERQEASKQQAAEPQSGDSAPPAQAKREAKARRAPAAPAKPSRKQDERAKAPASAPAPRDESSAAADAPSARKNALATAPTPSEGAPPSALSKEQQPVQGLVEQLQGERHARELFYAGVEPPRAPAASQSAEKAELGALKEKTARTTLAPLGLRYSVANQRLTIEANDSAYLYVLGRNAAGALTPLFPRKGTGAQAARVEKGKRYTVEAPSDISQVIIALSRQPRADLQGAPAGPPSTTTSLLIEKAEEAAPSQESERAVYVVNPSSDPSAGIIFETTLSNR
jgi:cytoskeletal protein RodZ